MTTLLMLRRREAECVLQDASLRELLNMRAWSVAQ
jgi:hypothetical protein